MLVLINHADSLGTMRLTTVALIGTVAVAGFMGYWAGSFKPAATVTTITTDTTTQTTTFLPNFVNGYLGQWNHTADYPVPVQGLACVSNVGYVYCVGGGSEDSAGRVGDVIFNGSYYAALSSNGIDHWVQTTSYPVPIQGADCATQFGYVYCVGGWGPNQTYATRDSYFAPISSAGIGQWKATTPYPVPASGPACVTYSRFIYCVQTHWNESSGYLGPQDVFFAPISSEGIGNWTQTLGFSAVTAGCSEYSGFAYCYGGALGCRHDCTAPPNYAHYAQLLANGTGQWLETTNVLQGWGPYVEAGPFVYAFGTVVHYTFWQGWLPIGNATSDVDVVHLSSDGISSSSKTAQFPLPGPGACISSGEYIYCIGGYQNLPESSPNFPGLSSVSDCYFTRIAS